MSTIQEIIEINNLQNQINDLNQTIKNKNIEVLNKLLTVVEVFSDRWEKVHREVADVLNTLVENNNVQYSSISCDDYSFDLLMWQIGSYLPIFSESCEFIKDYDIVRDDSNITLSISSEIYEVSVSYEGQDGFEIALPKNVWDLFETTKDSNFDKAIKNYVDARIAKALEEIEKECIPKMTPAAKQNIKINKKELEKQAAALGLKLVPQ